jgi:Coenzyme PQQ synthesis protein D (PqqD)
MNEAEIELTITPSDAVRDVENQDGAVLLDIQQGICFSLNSVGSRIWQMLKTRHSVDQIVERLRAEFDIPKEQLERDVHEFVQALRVKKLLKLPEVRKNHGTVHWFQRVWSRLVPRAKV